MIASSSLLKTVETGTVGPVLRPSTAAPSRHLRTVFGLVSSVILNPEAEACDHWIAALTACVVVAIP